MAFKGKVVLVTGASAGIGAATAIKFSEEGAKVCLVARNKDKLNDVAKRCENSLVLVADVSKDDDVKRIVNETIRHFGQLDVLVNNAGIGGSVSILQENAIEVFDRVMATNLRGAVLLTNLAAPHLVKTKGNIINISSVASLQAIHKGSFSYCTSKAGLDHFTRSVALELAPKGVRVNSVNPGPVKTDFAKNSGTSKVIIEGAADIVKKVTALQRASEPEEVAEVILFLAGDKAKAITGSMYLTDNGMTLKGPMDF